MFLNIREEDIRADCPHNAPLTLRAFNKINPREFNTSISSLNPIEIPRYAPTTVGQFSKALVQQQRGNGGQITNALAVATVQEAILAETEVEDFIMDYGDQITEEERVDVEIEPDPQLQVTSEEEKIDQLIGELSRELPEVPPREIKKKIKIKLNKPRGRRTAKEMKEAREMGNEDFRSRLVENEKPLKEQQSSLRGASQEISDEERLRALEQRHGIDYGGGGGVYGE
tara:strand:- start:580 stop:1263 length:684 start_codon:yes stop_codon:yes gene_type:complete